MRAFRSGTRVTVNEVGCWAWQREILRRLCPTGVGSCAPGSERDPEYLRHDAVCIFRRMAGTAIGPRIGCGPREAQLVRWDNGYEEQVLLNWLQPVAVGKTAGLSGAFAAVRASMVPSRRAGSIAPRICWFLSVKLPDGYEAALEGPLCGEQAVVDAHIEMRKTWWTRAMARPLAGRSLTFDVWGSYQ